eukprot:contig_6817_g1569
MDQGGQAHLLYAARIIRDEWDKVTPVQISICWLTADVLPNEAVADVGNNVPSSYRSSAGSPCQIGPT